MKQEFKVTIRVRMDTKTTDAKPLTEARILKQIGKLLKGHSIYEGLPLHGDSFLEVTDVIEEKQ